MTKNLDMTFHHTAVAVADMQEALELYTGVFGFEKLTEPVEVRSQKVNVCFVQAPPGVMIELVAGIGEGSPVTKLLNKNRPGPYHICYRVKDLDNALAVLESQGCTVFKRFEMPTHGLRRFAFLLAPDNQVFELCEEDH